MMLDIALTFLTLCFSYLFSPFFYHPSDFGSCFGRSLACGNLEKPLMDILGNSTGIPFGPRKRDCCPDCNGCFRCGSYKLPTKKAPSSLFFCGPGDPWIHCHAPPSASAMAPFLLLCTWLLNYNCCTGHYCFRARFWPVLQLAC